MRQTVKAGRVINRNYTLLFRDGKQFWKNTVEMIDKKYPASDVNLTCYGCSDGSEPFTFVISMFEWAKKLFDKCKPINAYDVDPKIIAQAKSGICNVNDEDLYFISNNVLKKHYSEHFSMTQRTDNSFDIAVIPKKHITDKIKFGIADIFQHIDTLKPMNKNGIFCRNFWNYLPKEKQGPLAEKLHDKTLRDGFIVIGDYDIRNNIPTILERHNFKQDENNKMIFYAK